MKRYAAILAGLAIAAAACSGSKDEGIAKGTTATSSPPTATATPAIAAGTTATLPPSTPTATPTPAPTATPTPERPAPALEVAYFAARADRTFRFVGIVRNPSARTLEGLRIRWDAYSADNAIVGSFPAYMPAIGGGKEFLYVGGAGGGLLQGVPASVKLTVMEPGRLVDTPSDIFTAEPGTVAAEAFPSGDSRQYRAAANVTTGDKEQDRSNMVVTVVLRDAAGAIVGASFDTLLTSLPDKVPAGTKFRSEIRFIDATGTPATAEFISYAARRF